MPTTRRNAPLIVVEVLQSGDRSVQARPLSAATVVRRGLPPDSASRRPTPCAATLMNRTEKGAGKAASEDQRDRRFTGQLDKYYDRVVSCIRDADSILILGPGEAKVELEARLERKALGERIAAIETVDKMTDHQIAAKVRQRFPTER